MVTLDGGARRAEASGAAIGGSLGGGAGSGERRSAFRLWVQRSIGWALVLGLLWALIMPVYDTDPDETWAEGFWRYCFQLPLWALAGAGFGMLAGLSFVVGRCCSPFEKVVSLSKKVVSHSKSCFAFEISCFAFEKNLFRFRKVV